METYIVRIHRYEEEGNAPVSVGLVEDIGGGKTRKFASPEELLKILKLENTCADRKSKQ